MAARSRGGKGTNQEEVRRHNLATLLGHVHRSGGISRAELTRRMGLNRSTIADLVRELDELETVTQATPSIRTRAGSGRPSIAVRPASESVFVLAAEIGVESMQVARIGLGGEPLDRMSGATPSGGEPKEVVDRLVSMIEAMYASAHRKSRLVGVGLAVPGVVNDADGIVRFAPNLGWADVGFGQMLTERFPATVPIHLGNDGELGALAEHTRGAGRGKSDLIYLSCDVGVGGGVIAGGQAQRGATGYAGELGHMRFDPRGATCRCGNVGCWETSVGSHALAAALKLPVSRPELIALAVRDLIESGKRPSAALRKYGEALGIGLGGIVNVFNPQTIILGGVLRTVYPLIHDTVLAAMHSWALTAPADEVEVVLPGLGPNSVLLGAAEIAFSDLLADPVGLLAGQASGSAEF